MKGIKKLKLIRLVIVSLFLLLKVEFAIGQTELKVVLLDNTEQAYSIDSTGKLWFNSNNLTININDTIAPINIPLTEIRKITFVKSSVTTGISDVVKQNESISIFPNPTNSYFEVKTTGSKKLYIQIYNTSGSQVLSDVYDNSSKIDVSYLSAGIYTVIINNQTFKLIKQ
ncbi:MAG: T9SS type A sorting domain-containing protein [Bacteroidia bacterium]|nr:T9SS type A sorting domain-containing protein [Bacteroidia bacterium]